MVYRDILEILDDIDYHEELKKARQINDEYGVRRYSCFINERHRKKVMLAWFEKINGEYEDTSKTKSALGKFIRKYGLPLKELICLGKLITEDTPLFHFLGDENEGEKDIFRKYKVRYESSQLKKHKLVFKIVNPLTPSKARYQISYKAQLELKNKKYADEYEQLDLAFEEESKLNSPDQLTSLYYVIEPKSNFRDLVADEKLKEALNSAVARDTNSSKIFDEWGLGKMVEYGRGTTLNFRGPPGTGKTLAANCIAKELRKKLLMVRYDQIQNKYVGETEKHIQMVFKMAKIKNAVLFFDEADAIAHNRGNLTQSWEMSAVNTLLKELERFDGVCIFATNFGDKYDKAFERRLTMHVDFKLPTKEQAETILEKLLPKKAIEKGTSIKRLNIENMSGGDLKNVALNAAGVAAAESAPNIRREHIEKAITIVRNNQMCNKNELNYLG